jgi:hypothetical protein
MHGAKFQAAKFSASGCDGLTSIQVASGTQLPSLNALGADAPVFHRGIVKTWDTRHVAEIPCL